jgi:nucleoside-diphosphate-sugar epimerase
MYNLAEKIIKITDSKSTIKLVENPYFRKEYEVERRFGSSEKLMSLIKYKPETNLDEGLKRTYKHLLNN